jgi:hypothetical protein
LLAVALLCDTGSAARADIIFSNFGPNNSYDPGGGWQFGAVQPNAIQDIAVPFHVGSQPVTLDQVQVAMGLMSTPNVVTLEIVPSVQGAPGPDSQALESFQLTNKLPFLSGNGPLLVDSALHPLLDANASYWLVAAAAQPTEAIWYDNNLPVSGGTFAYRVNDRPWTAQAVDAIPVFAILGSPVPEPVTVHLLGIGALALLLYRCRRRLPCRSTRRRDTSQPLVSHP